MADASNVRHDTFVVAERMSPAQVRALAERKAQAQVGEDEMVAFLHLHGSRLRYLATHAPCDANCTETQPRNALPA